MKSTVGEIARFVRGTLERGVPERVFEGGVSIDSRTLAAGDLFVAIRGPKHDGHEFVSQALERGASGLLVSETVAAPDAAFVIRVADTTRALQDLAASLRERAAVRVVAITGSMGKTTTKECAAAAVSVRHRVLKTEGNLNNQWGLPLTLLRLEDEDAAVLEMGMSAPGEIARLAEIARPDVGVVTNVAEAHLEFFGSLEGIADAKGELYAGLAPGATAVVNADDPLVLRQARRFSGRKLRYGIRGEAELRARAIETTPEGLAFEAEGVGETVEVLSRLTGEHNVYNLLAGLAAASALDVPLGEAARALASVEPARHRGERLPLASGAVVIDETYNANPRAVAAVLEQLVREPQARRRIAVLGDMLELGEASEAMHRATGRDVAARGIDHLVGVGELGAEIVEGARAAGMPEARLDAVAGAEEAGRLVAALAREGDVVLFKASRGLGLERAIEVLRAEEGG